MLRGSWSPCRGLNRRTPRGGRVAADADRSRLRLPAGRSPAGAWAWTSPIRRRPSTRVSADHAAGRVDGRGRRRGRLRSRWLAGFLRHGQRRRSENHLYRNQGDGTFRDVARGDARRRREPSGHGRLDGRRLGRLRQRRLRGSVLYKYGRPELFHNDEGQRVHAGGRAGRSAEVGQRQQRDLARLRSRRPSRSPAVGILARGRRSLAFDDDARDAGELRVCGERRPEVCAPQQGRWHVRRHHRERRAEFAPLDTRRRRRAICRAAAFRICFSPTTTASRSST